MALERADREFITKAAASDEAADEPKEEAKKIQTEFTVTMTAFDAKQKIKGCYIIKTDKL